MTSLPTRIRYRFLFLFTNAIVIATLLASGSSPVVAAVITATDDLAFTTAGRNMWGPGPSFAMDKTWTDFILNFDSGGKQTIGATPLGTGVSLDYEFNGRVGLEPRLRIDTGTVNVAYPLRLNALLPDKVDRGQSFTINTANWLHLPSSLGTQGPLARFTLDAILEFHSTLGPGAISAVGFDIVTIDPFTLGFDYRKSIIDIGSGSSSIEFPTGPYGTITLAVPDQLTTFTDILQPPPELRRLLSSGEGANRFLNLAVDLDAVAVSLFGLPPNLLGDTFNIVSTDSNNDGKKDLSLSYELLNVLANLGLKFAQQFTFIPASIDVVMVSSTGQVRSGLLGDSFEFTAPNVGGALIIDADFTINGQLRNQTGVVVNGSLQVQAGKFVLHNEFGPDFELNLASDLLGLNSDFLFDQEFPEGGLNIGPPIYLFDSTFALGGFDVAHAQYRIQVIPVPATLLLLGLGLGSMLASLRARRGLGYAQKRWARAGGTGAVPGVREAHVREDLPNNVDVRLKPSRWA